MLYDACQNSRYDVVNDLLEAGASVDLTLNGGTPLSVACEERLGDCIITLLSHGADATRAGTLRGLSLVNDHLSKMYPLEDPTDRAWMSSRQARALSQYRSMLRARLAPAVMLDIRLHVLGPRHQHPERQAARDLLPRIASFLLPVPLCV